jgi:hypothetical protein
MPEQDDPRAVWRKSGRSNGSGGNCVEVASNVPGVVAVRDSKDPHGPRLVSPRPRGRHSPPGSATATSTPPDPSRLVP